MVEVEPQPSSAPPVLSQAVRSMSGRLDPPDPADSSCSSSAADSFPLRRLLPLPAAAAAEPGSERAAGREKSEVRAGSRVSVSPDEGGGGGVVVEALLSVCQLVVIK